MPSSPKRSVAHFGPDQQQVREQEVLRATRELAAYFKGRRTEREARAALKIIKAFIRDRERIDPAKRRPLPGAPSTTDAVQPRKPPGAGGRTAQRSARRTDGHAPVNADAAPLSTTSSEESSSNRE